MPLPASGSRLPLSLIYLKFLSHRSPLGILHINGKIFSIVYIISTFWYVRERRQSNDPEEVLYFQITYAFIICIDGYKTSLTNRRTKFRVINSMETVVRSILHVCNIFSLSCLLLVALTGFVWHFICRVVLQKLTSSTLILFSYCLTILSYICIKISDYAFS